MMKKPKKDGYIKKLRLRTKQFIDDVEAHVTVTQALISLIINILLPGLGTMLSVSYVKASVILEQQKVMKPDDPNLILIPYYQHVKLVKKRGFKLGLLQLVTFPLFFLGWIWAFYTTFKIYRRSKQLNQTDSSKVVTNFNL